jgi:futalosine hydrolase
VQLTGCDALREVTRDCPVVLLTATEAEAAPLRDALLRPEEYVVATKAVVPGDLRSERPTGWASGRADDQGPAVGVALAVTGCDKANVAHALTCLLQAMVPAPRLVIQAGIAGAFPGADVGDIVLATHEIYSDTGSSSPEGWLSAAELGLPIACVAGSELGGRFPLDAGLVHAAAGVIEAIDWAGLDAQPAGVADNGRSPAVLRGPCVTASRVTGLRGEAEEVAARWGALAESMEGAAAAHICALYGVPFLEIRGISNLVVDRDRASWQVERAVRVAARAALAVTAALDRLPLSRR